MQGGGDQSLSDFGDQEGIALEKDPVGTCGVPIMFFLSTSSLNSQALIHLLPALLHSSNLRARSQRVTDFFKYGDSGHGVEDSRQDQEANEWGRSGKDPNHFRPAGLPDKY